VEAKRALPARLARPPISPWTRANVTSKIKIYLLSVVTIPLVIQSLVSVALVLKYDLIPKSLVAESDGVQLVSTIFLTVVTVIIFIGIVLVGLQRDWAPGYNGVATRDIGAPVQSYDGKYVPNPVVTEYSPAPNQWNSEPYNYGNRL
jgi:hypothetical protein